MLKSLHIRNYILIDSLDVEFPEGLIVITGATGAGKSILIGALGLLCGAKADAGAIAAGADSCVVEAEFIFKSDTLEALCAENDLDYNSGNLLVRRVVSSSGRSRSFVNDEPVSVGVLETLSSMLLDIHSQHDTLLLTDKKYQLEALDNFAGNGPLLKQTAGLWRELSGVNQQIVELNSKLDRARQENDYNSSLYEQLTKASIRPGELDELEAEQYKLAHSEQVKELLDGTQGLFEAEDYESVNASLLHIGRNLQKLAEFMPSFSDTVGRLEEARLELKDISEQVSTVNQSLSCDPEKLQSIDDRIGEIRALMKRHSCSSEEELVARRDELKELVTGLDTMSEQLEVLGKRHDELETELQGLFGKLHSGRLAAAGKFAGAVLENLRFMELDRSVFELSVTAAQASSRGCDEISFLFSSTGSNPVPVAKCASGGELSRIMLSLKQFMSGFMNMPTIIFDEIDTGVSGSVADRMGRVICNMGDGAQVFAITHLPQVAAKGKAHFLVEKTLGDGRGTSSLKKLSEQERVMEIARMLSGESTSPQAIANAESLLGLVR